LTSKLGVLLAISALLLTGTLYADAIQVAGSTTGTFSAGTPGYLTFGGTAFDVTTSAAGDFSNINLGNFSLGLCSSLFCESNYDNRSFALQVAFSLPVGISGTPANFVANLDGQVGRFFGFPSGNVDIDFNNAPMTLTYDNSLGSGSFNFAVGDIMNLGPNNTAQLKGTITGATFAPTPEPSSIILLCTTLGGLGLLARKRLRG